MRLEWLPITAMIIHAHPLRDRSAHHRRRRCHRVHPHRVRARVRHRVCSGQPLPRIKRMHTINPMSIHPMLLLLPMLNVLIMMRMHRRINMPSSTPTPTPTVLAGIAECGQCGGRSNRSKPPRKRQTRMSRELIDRTSMMCWIGMSRRARERSRSRIVRVHVVHLCERRMGLGMGSGGGRDGGMMMPLSMRRSSGGGRGGGVGSRESDDRERIPT